MPTTHFTDFYLTPLLNKINAEKKIGFRCSENYINIADVTPKAKNFIRDAKDAVKIFKFRFL